MRGGSRTIPDCLCPGARIGGRATQDCTLLRVRSTHWREGRGDSFGDAARRLGTFAPLRVERVDEVVCIGAYTISLEARTRSIAPWRGQANCCSWNDRRADPRVGGPGSRKSRFEGSFRRNGYFISPGFEFRLVGALLTNFHLPQSSLLMLVSAFAGRGGARRLSARVAARYRFFSMRLHVD